MTQRSSGLIRNVTDMVEDVFMYTNQSRTNPCALAKTVFPRNYLFISIILHKMRRHKTPPPTQDNNSIVVAHLNVFFCKPLNDNCVVNKHDDNLHLTKLIKYIV